MLIIEALFGYHDILNLDNSPTKWRQRPDMTLADKWDVKHQFKQTNKRVKDTHTHTERERERERERVLL